MIYSTILYNALVDNDNNFQTENEKGDDEGCKEGTLEWGEFDHVIITESLYILWSIIIIKMEVSN